MTAPHAVAVESALASEVRSISDSGGEFVSAMRAGGAPPLVLTVDVDADGKIRELHTVAATRKIAHLSFPN